MPRTPTISVRGVGNVSVPPDRTVVSFDISTMDMDYSRSASDLNERVATLRAGLKKSGIKPEDLKTTSFSIDPHHEWRGKDENRRQVFLGWVTRHRMKIELPIDRELLNKAFAAIASDEVKSSIEISFDVSDRDALRTKILEEATRVACRNAETMATAAGCKLGRALKIEYGWSELRISPLRYERNLMMSLEADATPDIEPDDIDASDSVTILFELL
ncbi:MAG: SIMPL domain-containing protein [Candidatus Krumholzibacteria bacterium]|nr:SIMPL domain-containing protein [Candidatus Krumholzibacteria bacterium]MDH4338514.1 SIMPL domain-containing protein [Candidatus Krumholzibacteria bacterium]MDH5269241.1 SIMPL domain-containing protein [Candidatus Krumholzibacteria bacterium]